MRIKKLDIYGFGKFVQEKIDFDSGLQVFYGENESGKSTLYAFIHAIFFGMPSKHENKVDFEPRTANQYGGSVTLLMDDGEEIVVERIKKASSSKLTVTFGDGRVGGEKELAEILQNIDRDLFERVFSFNLDTLSEVFKLDENEIGRFLMHTGVTGSDKLRTIEDSLLKDASNIFKKGGSVPPLNKKLKSIDEISKSLKEAKEKEGSYSTLLAQKSDTARDIELTKTQIESLELLMRDLKEKENLLPHETTRKILEKKISELSITKFPSNGRARIDELVSRETPLASTVEKKNLQLVNLNAKLAGESINEKALTYSDQIEESANLVYQINGLSEEQILIEEKLNNITHQVSQVESELGVNISEEFLSDVDLSVAVKSEIDDICASESRLEDNKQRVNREIIEINGELNSLGQTSSEMSNDAKRNPYGLIAWVLVVVMIFIETKAIALIALIVAIVFIVLSMKVGKGAGSNDVKSAKLESVKTRLETKKLELLELQKYEEQLNARKAEMSNAMQINPSVNGIVLRSIYDGMVNARKLCSERTELDHEFENKHAQSIELEKTIHKLGEKIGIASQSDPKIAVFEMKNALESSKFSKQNIENISKQIEEIKEELTTSKAELTQIRSEISELLAYADVENIEDFKILAEKKDDLKDFEKELDLILSKLDGVDFGDMSEIELQEKIESVQSELLEKRDELGGLLKKEAEVNHNISEIEEHGTVEDITQRHAQEFEQFNGDARQWMKLTLAKGVLAKAVDEFKTTKLPSVVKKANEYLEIMTDGKYKQIVFSEENGLIVVDKDGANTRARNLSRGTSELLYTSLKLAFVYSFQAQKLCPIILDDAFVNFDDQRVDRIIELLNKISEQQQVIFFTCHEHLSEKFNSKNVIILK